VADAISDLIWTNMGAEHDATLAEKERGYHVSHAGMATTLRDIARFGLLFTKNPPAGQKLIISDSIIKRTFGGRGDDQTTNQNGMLPLTYQWDMISNREELSKGGWAGQLLYINRDKDVVVAWFGTNLVADPESDSLPCRIIASSF